jgi:hypothetical protein
MTPAQKKVLASLLYKSQEYYGTKGFHHTSWHAVRNRLVDSGLVARSLYDEYSITDAGRACLQQLATEAEAAAATALGNANDARESGGNPDYWDRVAQRRLDEANEYRGKS